MDAESTPSDQLQIQILLRYVLNHLNAVFQEPCILYYGLVILGEIKKTIKTKERQ